MIFRCRRSPSAIKKKQLDILVVGAGSSTLPGADGTNNAYPARLQAALTAETARRHRESHDRREAAPHRG